MRRHFRVAGAVAMLLASPIAAQDRRTAGPRLPDNVRLIADIDYAGNDNPRQKLDLFLPADPDRAKPLPLVVWIHGGAWLAGDKRSGHGRIASLVATGKYVGASIAYRLSTEKIWPAQIHDCKAAIRWLRAHAKKNGIDPDRIAVWGSSAGGHLVAMLAVSGNARELEGKVGEHLDVSSAVTCAVDYFGPTEFTEMSKFPSQMDHDAPGSPESRLIGGPIQKNREASHAASPLKYISDGDAPILIAHGSEDPLVPYNQSEILHAALKKARLDSTLIKVIGGEHGFRSKELDRRVRLFLEKHLLGKKDVTISSEPVKDERVHE